MSQILSLIKPLLLKVANHPQTKLLVLQLLEKLVKTTDNSIDDTIIAIVKPALFTNQITGAVDTRYLK